MLLEGQDSHCRNRRGSGEDRDEAGAGGSAWGRRPPHAHAPCEFVCVSPRGRPGGPVRSQEKGKERIRKTVTDLPRPRVCRSHRAWSRQSGPHSRHRARPGQPPACTAVSGQQQGRGRTKVFAPLR